MNEWMDEWMLVEIALEQFLDYWKNAKIGFTGSCSFTIGWQKWIIPSSKCWGCNLPNEDVSDTTSKT